VNTSRLFGLPKSFSTDVTSIFGFTRASFEAEIGERERLQIAPNCTSTTITGTQISNPKIVKLRFTNAPRRSFEIIDFAF
jgi:hypothetical protein